MLSSIDGKEHHVTGETRAEAWAPWMDDRTTTKYQLQHLGYLRARKAKSDSTGQWSPALQFAGLNTPPELELSRRQPTASSGVRVPAAAGGAQSSVRTLHGVPQHAVPQASARSKAPAPPPARAGRPKERTLSHGWHVASPGAEALTGGFTLAAPLVLSPEENPFAKSSGSLAYWVSGLAAGAGLFCAVLLGHVLLKATSDVPALRAAPTAPASPPPVTPAAPVLAAEPAAAPPPPAAAAAPEAKSPALDGAGARSTAGRATDADAADSSADKPRSSRRWRRSSDVDVEPNAAAPRPRSRASDADVEPNAAAPRPRSRASDADVEPNAVAASSEPGMLRINSRPWSQVTLDGNAVGHTPLFDLRVAPGSHTIQLLNPEFGLSKTIHLKVAAGESVTRVELLEP